MRRYAQNTNVSSARSKDEIETLLRKAGAERIAFSSNTGRASVLFELHERSVLFELALPSRASFAAKLDGRTRRERPNPNADRDWERACRERWRALALAIKSKLVSIDAGIEQFEEAFLAHIVVFDEKNKKSARFAELAQSVIASSYRNGPPQLPSGK